MICEIIERILHIDIFIQEQKTGAVPELAEKIGVSERTTCRTIKRMKELGAPIGYQSPKKLITLKRRDVLHLKFPFQQKQNPQKQNLHLKA